ncbi:hypothetical protein Areg01_19620 [Actinoplanes regularis]|nr:hypothetical protein Areg01_19620 [Actinoplanes regularis]
MSAVGERRVEERTEFAGRPGEKNPHADDGSAVFERAGEMRGAVSSLLVGPADGPTGARRPDAGDCGVSQFSAARSGGKGPER